MLIIAELLCSLVYAASFPVWHLGETVPFETPSPSSSSSSSSDDDEEEEDELSLQDQELAV